MPGDGTNGPGAAVRHNLAHACAGIPPKTAGPRGIGVALPIRMRAFRLARPAPLLGYGLAALAVAAAALGVTRIDPHAFGPHASAEAGEAHEASPGARPVDDDDRLAPASA